MAVRRVTATSQAIAPYLPRTQVREDLQPNCWVELLDPPSEWCDSDVQLLCPTSDTREEWEVWIPAHGVKTVAARDLGSLSWCEKIKFLRA